MKTILFIQLWGRICILVLLFNLLAFKAKSQITQHILDSLEKALANHLQKDTTRIDILAWLSVANASRDPIKGIGNIKEALSIAATIKSNRDFGLWVMLGWAYIHIDDYPRSVEAFQEIFKIVPPESEEYAAALHFIGMNYKAQGDLDKALSYTKAGHEIEEKIKALGGQLKDPRTEVATPWNLGEIYLKKNDLDTALIYGQLAYFELHKADIEIQHQFRPMITTLLGNVYIQLSQKDSAKRYLDEAYQSMGKSYGSLQIIDITLSRAKWFTQFGSLDSAMLYATTAYKEATKLSRFDMMYQSAGVMRLIAEKMQKYELALKYNDIAIEVKDSMLGVDKIKKTQAMHYEYQLQEQQVENLRTELRLNNRVKLLGITSLFVALAGVFLFTNIQRRKKTIRQLNDQNLVIETQKTQLQQYIDELKEKQTQLIQSEKMASLGELTAGIAHEIQNPLNFVNNFSAINNELIEELKNEHTKTERDKPLEEEILLTLQENSKKIELHGKRAENIVRSMLEHSNNKPGNKVLTDINLLTEEFLRLSYHAIRAKDKSFNVTLFTEFDPSIPFLSIVSSEIGRVLINLFNNAFYSLKEKKHHVGESFHPTMWIYTRVSNLPNKAVEYVDLQIKDNGNGIKPTILSKIFQPFFTTKPTGNGTGLGLSLSYEIINKVHQGHLTVDSKEGEYCSFTISLPVTR